MQVSEFVKLVIILLVARFLTELKTENLEVRDMLKLAGLIAVPMLLVLAAILLPAGMRLLGDWNWWMPKFLDWIPRVTIEGEDYEIDLESPGMRLLAARGGKGGLGNVHFATSTHQVPRIAADGGTEVEHLEPGRVLAHRTEDLAHQQGLAGGLADGAQHLDRVPRLRAVGVPVTLLDAAALERGNLDRYDDVHRRTLTTGHYTADHRCRNGNS